MHFDNFFEALFNSLGRSLYFIVGAPDITKDIDWSELLMTASVKCTIICILILFFYCLYRLACKYSLLLLRYFKRSDNTQQIILSALKYFWWFASSIVVLSQMGVPYPFIKSLVRAVFVASFFGFLWVFLNPLLERLFKKYELNASIKQLIRNISSVLVIIFAIAALMQQFGFDLVSIVAGLGIVGLAVGFAAQSTLADFIAGVTILLEQPFKIGDWVNINGHDGKVEKISLRTTHIRSRTNVSIIMPNAKLASSEVINHSARKLCAFTVEFGIAYESNIEKARTAILKEVHEVDMVLKVPLPNIRVTTLADSGVNMVLFYWIASANIDKQPLVQAQLLELVKTTLDKQHIEIPYPHVQLLQNK